MNLKLKPILVNQKFTKNSIRKSKAEPETFKIDIKMPDKTAIINNIPASISLGMILSPFDINDEEFDITVNGFSVKNLDFGNTLSSFSCPNDKQINIIVSEKEDVPEEDPEYEDIDDLIEENSLLILENESLNNEIKYLRAELERVTKLKDVLLQAASEASAALTAPLAEFFIGKGELK